MINSVDPNSIGLLSSDARSQAIERLTRRADVNRDGQVTTAEFVGFLEDLMRSLDKELNAHRTPGAGRTPADATAYTAPNALAAASTMTPAQGAALLRRVFDTAGPGKVR